MFPSFANPASVNLVKAIAGNIKKNIYAGLHRNPATFWHRLKWLSKYPRISLIPTQILVHLQTDEIRRRDFEIRFVDLFLDKDGLMSIHFHLIVGTSAGGLVVTLESVLLLSQIFFFIGYLAVLFNFSLRRRLCYYFERFHLEAGI